MAEQKKSKPVNKIDWTRTHKDEAVQFVNSFYRTSFDWRRNAYHERWNKWERNYKSIYDPVIAGKKEPWQAKMFIPYSVAQVEVITSAVTKVLFGRERPIGFKPREMGDELQAELHTNLLDYEVDRSGTPLAFYDAMKEAGQFGSGFVKCYWNKKKDKRRLRVPKYGKFSESLPQGQLPPVEGYEEQVTDVYVRDNAVIEKVHIRDIFLEPNSKDIERILHRQKITYAELLENVSNGFDEEAVKALRDVKESDNFEEDVQVVQHEQDRQSPSLVRPDFDKRHTVWEYWGLIPRKWIELNMPETTQDERDAANELVHGKLMVASGKWFLASEENPYQDMLPPFVKCDYIRTGETYGIGVCQLIEGLQEEANEIRNQRVDNVNLILNKMVAVFEKYLVDPDVVSQPGGMVRLQNFGNTDMDIRKIFLPIEFPDVAVSGYKETFEIERQIQEVTGANRVTTGTAGLVDDQNNTLGGMELLRQSAADRFTMYAYIIGRAFVIQVAKKLMQLIYQYRSDDSVKRILGRQPVEILPGEIIPKWAAFIRMPPHELEQDYDLVPYDVFSEENKQAKSAQMMNYGQFLAGIFPQLDMKPMAEEIGRLIGIPADKVSRILASVQGPIQTPLASGIGQPSLPKPNRQTMGETPSPTSTAAGPLKGFPE